MILGNDDGVSPIVMAIAWLLLLYHDDGNGDGDGFWIRFDNDFEYFGQ